VNPSTNLTVIQTMSTTTAYIGGTPTRAFGMYAGSPAPSLPAAGTYNPSWTLSNSGRMTHLALVIAPASS
jgi:hypothetical protein